MINEVYKAMLAGYDLSTEQGERNAMFEVAQQVILSGLSAGGFFDIAAFYGGTCLRIFHGMERFSEDMDFTLLKPDVAFSLEKYFKPIIDEFAYIGRSVEIKKKEKRNFSRVESAFLKDNTDVYDLTFQTSKALKIKIEVDINPPLSFNTEYKLLMQPRSFMTKCLALPDLFAGKMHALVFRTWKSRVKGRDWYDFEWYVRHNTPLHYEHLKERIREFNGKDMEWEEFKEKLIECLTTTDILRVKEDVAPFVRRPSDLDIWSNEYFVELTKKINVR